MYIEENELISISIKCRKVWEKKLDRKIDNDKIDVHWSLLISTKFRTLCIDVICDHCQIIHKRRIRDLDPNKNIHYCKNCILLGDRNGSYGKSMNEKTRMALKNYVIEFGNPFSRPEVIEKIKSKKPWEKTAIVNTGKKRTQEVKDKMSESAILAFKEGRRVPTNGWSKIFTKEYKHLTYQSKYELNFIKYVESLGFINEISNGPHITYFDDGGKEHVYYIDFQINGTNTVFEIKSSYYWNKKIETNISKMEEAKKFYEYYLIINNNFTEIDNILKNVKKI